MKITILQGAFLPIPPLLGGAVEKIWYKLGAEFAELGHDVSHISRTYPGLKDEEVENGVHYIRIEGYDTPSSLVKLKWLDLLYTKRALKKISKNTDIIITNTFWSPFILRGAMGKKVYVDVQRVPKGQMRFYKHVGVLRGCSIAIFEAIKRELPQSLADIVSYVPNPVPFEVKDYNLKKENIILFVGRIHPEKGVDVLIKAFAELEKNGAAKDWKLVIIGPYEVKDGGGGIEYHSKILTLSKNVNVDLVGPIYDENKLTEFYARASIFCYPAQDGSGDAAPVAPREAMAYGCVPIVSKLGCFEDFITNDLNGVTYNQNSNNQEGELCEVFDKLIKDDELRDKLAAEAKKVAEIFSPKFIAKKFIEDFEKIKKR